jgi:hypothetical protein
MGEWLYRPVHTFLILRLDYDKADSRSSRFIPMTQCIEDWMGPIADMVVEAKKRPLPLLGVDPR